MATDIANGKVTFDAGVIEAKWSDLRKIIEPMINAIRADIAALRNGSEPANGTGPDQLPDALDISTTRDKNGTSTIEITIKIADDGQQMPEIRFTHSMLLASILVANGITPTAVGGKTITAASLPASGTSAQIADLLKPMNACFALPTARRVNSLTGTGANVIAPSASRFSRMTVLLTIFTSVQG